MRNLTHQDFAALWNSAPAVLVNGILATQDDAWAKGGINKALRLAHFMAQISHESGTGNEMVENLNYSAERLLSLWPSHFNSVEAHEYGRTNEHPANQRMIGNLAYGGRNGNAAYPSNDGYNYRGRGLLQITGKANYRNIGHMAGLDLVSHPELTIDPLHCLVVAVTEFKASGCLPYCDADDLVAVSALVNVGHVTRDTSRIVGYASRVAWLAKWKTQLGL